MEKKLLAVSQRVDEDNPHQERRDCLDQRWVNFLSKCGFLPIPLPNNLAVVKELFRSLPLGGVLLTGGNSLGVAGGKAPERDSVEMFLVGHCLENQMPLLGVCRGMQVLQFHFRNPPIPISGHVSRKMEIEVEGRTRIVNSYHDFGHYKAAPGFEVWARAKDSVVKAVRHCEEALCGIMWHPERQNPFDEADIQLFSDFYSKTPSLELISGMKK